MTKHKQPNYFISSFLSVKESPGKGLGVFSEKNIKKGTVLEISPGIIIKEKEYKKMNTSIFSYYVFGIKKDAILALGYSSLYNHSSDPSAYVEHEGRSMYVVARKNIKKGEEITIDYGWEP